MAHVEESFLVELRSLSLAAKAGTMVLVALAVYAVVAPVGWCVSGPAALVAAAVAAGVCLLSTMLALAVSHPMRGPEGVLRGMLFGMMLRTGIPLILALAFCVQDGGLADAGVIYYLLVFYPAMLGMETVLSLPTTMLPRRCAKTTQDIS